MLQLRIGACGEGRESMELHASARLGATGKFEASGRMDLDNTAFSVRT